jgi:hypothetical protein
MSIFHFDCVEDLSSKDICHDYYDRFCYCHSLPAGIIADSRGLQPHI